MGNARAAARLCKTRQRLDVSDDISDAHGGERGKDSTAEAEQP